jgi:hypothetical protein
VSAGLPPEVALLLAAEREAEGPPDLARARVQARLEATLGIAVGTAAVGTAAVTAATASGKAVAVTGKAAALGWQALAAHLLATKIVIAVAATGSVVGAGYLVTRAVGRHEARLHRAEAHGAVHGGFSGRRNAAGGGAADESGTTPETIAAAPFDPGDPVGAPGAAPAGAAPAVAAPSLAAATGTASSVASADVHEGGAAHGGGTAHAGEAARGGMAAHGNAANAGVAHAGDGAAEAWHKAAHHGGLGVERDLVARARQALLARDFAAADDALMRHARRFPDGQMAEERDSLRVRVAVARGDHDAARALAAEFARRHPGSLFWPAVRAAVSQ